MVDFLRVLSGVLIFLALLGGVALIVLSKKDYIKKEDSKEYRRLSKIILTRVLPFSIILLIFSCSMEIIPTGYTGVKTTFGQIDPDTLQNGLCWQIPFVQKIEKVNNKQQDISFESQVWSETNQRTAIYYEKVTVTYRINPDKSAWIYATVADYQNSLVSEGLVQSSLKASSKQLPDVDATNRSIIEPLCKEYLQKALDDKYGPEVVMITKVIIGNADFDKAYNDTILAKQQAQIEAEKQAIENERRIAKAEADAKVLETETAAKANAKLIEAEATAEANRILEESITEEVVVKMWLDKWDGKLPYYITGDMTNNMIGIGIPSDSLGVTPIVTPAVTE